MGRQPEDEHCPHPARDQEEEEEEVRMCARACVLVFCLPLISRSHG